MSAALSNIYEFPYYSYLLSLIVFKLTQQMCACDSPCMTEAQIMSDFMNREREWMIYDTAYWSHIVAQHEMGIGEERMRIWVPFCLSKIN